MNLNRIIQTVFLFGSITATAQLSDRMWFTGFNEYPGVAGYGHAQILFSSDSINPQIDSIGAAFNFESMLAMAVDKNEGLLFYSNGCEIANRNHVVMPNGSGLNPGSISDQVCPWKGYILPQSALVLPDPAHSGRYMLLHMGAGYTPELGLRRTQLYYSAIDMSLDQGLGDVVSKNNILLSGDLGAFTAIRHGNGRDWWIIAPEFGNKNWHTFLLSPGGIEAMPVQQLSIGQSGCRHQEACVASKDGSRIAAWGDCKISVLDFDRCDGTLSAFSDIHPSKRLIPGGGLAFSPSGRFLYVCSQTVLYRADMETASPQLDTMRFSYDPYLLSPYDVPGNTFHYLANMPNGYIYAGNPSRRRYLHLLKKPEAPTQSGISFVPQGLSLPVVSVRTLPYFPNYQLFDLADSPCDTLGINTINADKQAPDSDVLLRLFPNPAQDRFFIAAENESALDFPLALKIFTPLGALALEKEIPRLPFAVEWGLLPPSSYFYHIFDRESVRLTSGVILKTD